MFRYLLPAILLAFLFPAANTHANPGPAPSGTAIAQYDWLTGEIVVSVADVNNWFIESASYGLTGTEPLALPAGGGIESNDDNVIGETKFASTFSYTDLNLGSVAAPGLLYNDLTISSNAGLGEPLITDAVTYINVPDNFAPTADIEGPIRVNTFDDPLNVLLDASGSFDDGGPSPLTYRWDLDNNGIFEISSGTNPTYEIADVTETFGSILGTYPVSVEVFDGEFFDVASTEVRLTYAEPVPPPALVFYDPTTGEITVSVEGVINWYIESESLGFTGDDPVGIPASGGLVSDTDGIIGETKFSHMSYTVNLGNVAETSLPHGDLSVFWNTGLGEPLLSTSVVYTSSTEIPEPTALALTSLAALALLTLRRRTIPPQA